MWVKVETEKDVEDFMNNYGIALDNCCPNIDSVRYENYKLLLAVDSWRFGKMELLFEDVMHFSFSGRDDRNIHNLGGFELSVRDDLLGTAHRQNLLIWTDNCKVSHCNGYFDPIKDNSVIICKSMKYRFIGVDDVETEQSLKDIVEENYLIEIAWDYFWENLDSYINSPEALEYGIKSRQDIKPYFESYALKHFPDSSETLIVMTIKFYSAENNKYIGYYDLVFNKNLEITDDFFVTE